jgi:hypothetical protein
VYGVKYFLSSFKGSRTGSGKQAIMLDSGVLKWVERVSTLIGRAPEVQLWTFRFFVRRYNRGH